MATIYLLHFERRLHHAGHYVGWAKRLAQRLAHHEAGTGARLTQVVRERGVGWVCARTWKGDRSAERRIKQRKDAPRLCPLCSGEAALRRCRKP